MHPLESVGLFNTMPEIFTVDPSRNLAGYLKGFDSFFIRNLAKLEAKNSKPD